MSTPANNDSKIITMTAEVATDHTPRWLKAELFEELLGKTIEGYQQIKSFKVVPATAVGENFATKLLRLEFEIALKDDKSHTCSLMIKVGSDTEIFQDMMKKTNIFAVENEMYTQIVPEMEQQYRDVGVEVKFGAACFEIQAPNDYVLMENLAANDFKNTNRLEGLDMAHMQSVLRKIAQWHAASAVRVDVKGPYAKTTQGFIAKEQVKIMEGLLKNCYKTFLQSAATYKGNEEYIEQLQLLEKEIFDILLKLYKVDPNEFNALNHGDLWSNNVMFQYDAHGKIKETYFVDYQMPKYGSVAQDLYYILITSTKLEHKFSKFEYFLKFYHDNLIEHLQLLKYKRPLPKLRDLHASLFRYDIWGLIVAMGPMPAVLLDPMENAVFDNFIGDSAEANEFQKIIYAAPRYRKHMEATLSWMGLRGAFEI